MACKTSINSQKPFVNENILFWFSPQLIHGIIIRSGCIHGFSLFTPLMQYILFCIVLKGEEENNIRCFRFWTFFCDTIAYIERLNMLFDQISQFSGKDHIMCTEVITTTQPLVSSSFTQITIRQNHRDSVQVRAPSIRFFIRISIKNIQKLFAHKKKFKTKSHRIDVNFSSQAEAIEIGQLLC